MLDPKETIRENQGQPLEDPFAVDFFGSSVPSLEEVPGLQEYIAEQYPPEEEPAEPIPPKKLWSEPLPKITRDEFLFSNMAKVIPAGLSREGLSALNESLSRFIFGEAKGVAARVLSVKEINFGEIFLEAENEQSVFVSLAAEPSGEYASIIIDSIFASQLVDKTLGDLGLSSLVRRSLSKTEETVIEFLAVSLLSEFNEKLNEPLIRIVASEQCSPSWFQALQDKAFQRGMMASIRLKIGDIVGVIKVVFSFRFVEELNKFENPLLINHDPQEEFLAFKKISSGLESGLLVGKTRFSGREMISLEVGDFIVIEEAFLEWENTLLKGSTHIKCAENFFIECSIDQTPFGIISASIEGIDISDRQIRALERIKMDAEINEEIEEQMEDVSIPLNNVMLNVDIILAGRRMNLEELSRLRSGQIIELGCKATDAVELQTDGKRIATGDLLEIEGNLGVRLTKVFV